MACADFVDVRLHVAVRPRLEYMIPELSSDVRAYLLGDRDRHCAIHALDELAGAFLEAKDAPDAASLHEEAEAWAQQPSLQRASARVCTHACDYLTALADAWADLLARVAQAVRDEERAVRAALAAASRDGGRAHVARLAQQLEAFLAECRERTPSVTARPQELVQASAELKEAFATSYGTVPTNTLVRLKAAFERELRAVQRPVAKAFLARVRKLIPPPAA